MGNFQSDICQSLNICGPEQEERDNEFQNEIMPQYQLQNDNNYNPQYDNQYDNQHNNNQYSNNQYSNNQYTNNQYNNNQNQPPITSNTKTYTEQKTAQISYRTPQQYTRINKAKTTKYDNTPKKAKTPPYQMVIPSPTPTTSNYQSPSPGLDGYNVQYMTQTQKSTSIKRNYGYYDQINITKIRISYPKHDIVQKVEKQCDIYCTKMLTKKIQETINQNAAKISYPQCNFPAPYNVQNLTVPISCCSTERHDKYFLPAIDEYFGSLSNAHQYSELNEYKIPYSSSAQNSVINSQDAQSYIHHNIYKPLYDNDKYKNIVMKKRFNQWASVRLDKLQGFKYSGNIDDLWLTLIAFSGFAAHRTVPFNPGQYSQNDIAFENDTTFLSFYKVRKGYVKYGAKAFFDKSFCIKRIYLSYNGKTYTPDAYSKAEWEHAKWVWKVSVTVATFLVDMIAHCRFREASGLIKAVQSSLNPNHPIRRLLLPFTYGTVYANNVYSEYLKENGLFHRAFGFTYGELSRLMRDAMMDAPKDREREDYVKYRWKFARKKCSAMKNCPDQIYPFYSDLYSFWVDTLDFVSNYVFNYYNDDEEDQELLHADTEMVAFYAALIRNSGIDNKFKLKKYNITNMLTHFICNATLWNNHLASAVSFQYLVDPKFNGLKINGGGAIGCDAQGYVEYCTVALSSGWNIMDFKGYNVMFNVNNEGKGALWKNVLLNDGKYGNNVKYFDKYFGIGTKPHYNKQRIVQYTAANPNYFCCSVML